VGAIFPAPLADPHAAVFDTVRVEPLEMTGTMAALANEKKYSMCIVCLFLCFCSRWHFTAFDLFIAIPPQCRHHLDAPQKPVEFAKFQGYQCALFCLALVIDV
jgi:hypothetical protein